MMRDTHRPALRAQNHQVRNRDGALALGDAEYAPVLAFIAARDHPHLVVLLDLNAHRLRRFAPRERHQITSGARDTIFINFLSRSSRATGPNTRVPTGSLVSLISTAAFESNRI